MTGLQSISRAPGWLPLIGHALPLARNPFGFITTLHEHGDLVRVDLGTMPTVFVTNSALAYEVMVTQARKLEKGRFFQRLRDLVGDGLATSDGEVHLRHRRLMQPMFHRQRIAGYARSMSDRARELAESWTDGETVMADSVMAEFVVNTLAAAMFSTDIGAPAADVVRRQVPVIIQNLLLRTVSPPMLDRLPIPANRAFDRATKELLRVIDDVVVAARRAGGHDEKPDLLSVLLAARDEETEERLSDEEVRDELGTILFAGTETTAATLSWALYEIATHPEVERQLLAEIDSVVGTRPVTVEDIGRMTYLRRVVDEVARLHGVTLLMRRTLEPVELAGVTLPKGTEIAFSLYALLRDPRVYARADRFDPDRWLPERAAGLPRHAYMPFGAGTRKCIGDAFAATEIMITLATVLSRWQLRPLAGHTPREAAAAMPHPDKLPMTVTRRRPPAAAIA